jgi:hypothetical protein
MVRLRPLDSDCTGVSAADQAKQLAHEADYAGMRSSATRPSPWEMCVSVLAGLERARFATQERPAGERRSCRKYIPVGQRRLAQRAERSHETATRDLADREQWRQCDQAKRNFSLDFKFT